MSVKLLTEHYLVFLSLKGDCTGLSESTLVKMPHWKSHVAAHIIFSLEKGLLFSVNTLLADGSHEVSIFYGLECKKNAKGVIVLTIVE